MNLADSMSCDTEGLALSVVVGALARLGYKYIPLTDRFDERTA